LEVHAEAIEDTVALDSAGYFTLVDVGALNEPFVIGAGISAVGTQL
jgi:hypothetical protein